jgi:hypothetical protein
MTKRSLFLETLPSGEKVGKLPGSLGTDKLRALGHPESPIAAIRLKCIDCCGGNKSEVRKCPAINCPLWPMRMGRNPFHGNGASDLLPLFETAEE